MFCCGQLRHDLGRLAQLFPDVESPDVIVHGPVGLLRSACAAIMEGVGNAMEKLPESEPAEETAGAAQRLAPILLDAATSLVDLRSLAFVLEKLAGNRAGEYRIRINDQFRICFPWSEPGAYDVEITDYAERLSNMTTNAQNSTPARP
jgi:proteic killer suppression protein